MAALHLCRITLIEQLVEVNGVIASLQYLLILDRLSINKIILQILITVNYSNQSYEI